MTVTKYCNCDICGSKFEYINNPTDSKWKDNRANIEVTFHPGSNHRNYSANNQYNNICFDCGNKLKKIIKKSINDMKQEKNETNLKKL